MSDNKTHQRKRRYACPMHPKITSDKPGKCSECGMDMIKSNGKRQSENYEHNSHESYRMS